MEQDLKYLDQDAGPQEKAKLLDQIKEDNLEMAGMERKISELEDQSKKLQQQIAHLDQAIEEDEQPSGKMNRVIT
jgi:intraflagellar transport protein 74